MKAIYNWLKKQNEYIPLVAALVLFYVSPGILRYFDPTAGSYDIGVLQVDIVAIISFCVFQAIVWMTLKVNWFGIREYFEHVFNSEFYLLEPWQRIIISLSVYFGLLFSLVLLSKAI